MRRNLSATTLLRLVACLVALFVAAEPVVHSHPLVERSHNGTAPASTTVCAACAAGTARLTSHRPAIRTVTLVLYRLTVSPTSHVSVDTFLALPSRAPPAG